MKFPILNHPFILLADEPTGNLDPKTSAEILDLFIRLNTEGKTVIMVTHDYATISKKPARTLVCAEGKIMDTVTHISNDDFKNLLEQN